MAASQVEVEGAETQLKHLSFIRVLAVNTVVLVSNLYDYAKQNAGSFKSSLGVVENTVKAAVEPVYDRFKDVPTYFLVFLDGKVDVIVNKFDEVAPPPAKKLISEAHTAINKASQIAKQLLVEAQSDGPVAALLHASQISKQFAVTRLALVWYKVNAYPALSGLTQLALPTATYWSKKYNNLITGLKQKGCTIFCYAPLVPIEEIAKAYEQVQEGEAKED